MVKAFFALLTLAAIGAIAGDVLMHPKGTAAAADGINKLIQTALMGAGGMYSSNADYAGEGGGGGGGGAVRGGGGRRRKRGRRR